MIILIDAYNVIRFLQPGRAGDGDAQQAWFLHKLAAYRREKRAEIEDIIVVFDGGVFSHKMREVVSGIVVVHAGVRRTADDVLVQYAQDFGSRSLLVSNDRELGKRVAVHRGAVMGVQEFWGLLTAVTTRLLPESSRWGAVEITKNTTFDDDCGDEMASESLDALMIEGSIAAGGHKDDGGEKRRRSGVTLSKKEKEAARLRKKIG